MPLQCLWRDSVTLISTLLLTYLLVVESLVCNVFVLHCLYVTLEVDICEVTVSASTCTCSFCVCRLRAFLANMPNLPNQPMILQRQLMSQQQLLWCRTLSVGLSLQKLLNTTASFFHLITGRWTHPHFLSWSLLFSIRRRRSLLGT